MSNPKNDTSKTDMKPPEPLFQVPFARPAEQKTRMSKFTDTPVATNGKSRKSKFTDHPLGVVPPPPSVVDPKQAAALAAAKINANLRAKGKLSDETLLKPVLAPVSTTNTLLNIIQISPTTKVFDSYVAKIDINDLPVSVRSHFLQSSVLDGVGTQTGASISSKGQCLTVEEKSRLNGIEKQLHLFIQSPLKLKVDMALSKLREMISKHPVASSNTNVTGGLTGISQLPQKPIIPPVGQPTLPTGSYMQEKVFVGLDHASKDFDLKTKLIGQNYTNFNFVANSTGAKVILRGRGSGFIEPTSGREAFEAMYVFISHNTQTGVDSAKKLVRNLIDTVKNDLTTYMSRNSFSSQHRLQQNKFSAYPTQPRMPMPAAPFAPMPNPYFATPPGVPPYNVPPTNPYPLPIPAQTGEIQAAPPVPAPIPPLSDTQEPINPPGVDPDPVAPTSNLMPPPPAPVPPKVQETKPNKKRRFKEEQPDDSDVLGYSQVSSKQESEEKQKKTKRTFKEDTKVSAIPEDDSKPSNMPFWMSHSYD
uniref:KH homology domain-containing protein 4 n=1 Tax=Phallusia mammillata TaxID=59560 RepID=A0A6F9DG80_9ASCI|nr:UPF0469 protein KIAA0907-like [Phallusia mammillata]